MTGLGKDNLDYYALEVGILSVSCRALGILIARYYKRQTAREGLYMPTWYGRENGGIPADIFSREFSLDFEMIGSDERGSTDRISNESRC